MGDKRAGRTPRENPPHIDEPVLLQEVRVDPSAGSYSGRSETALVLGERHPFYCQVCEHEADAARKRDSLTGEPRWLVGNSFTPRCPKQGACLRAIAQELGTTAAALKDDPLAHLGPWLRRAKRAVRAEPPTPPSIGQVGGWHSRLLTAPRPLGYLTERRALAESVLRRFCVGWDGRNLTFPAWEGERPSYLYRRRPVDGARIIAMGGPRQPYPDLPEKGALVLVAGEIDALAGRQLGLRTTTISGCSLPDHALPRFAGRCVYVMFDVGEEVAAERVAAKLGAAGCRAWVACLGRLGLGEGGDLNDYVCCGGNGREVAELLRGCRRAA